MKKHFKLQNYIEDEAEDEDECSKDEDEIDDTKIDTQIINVKANLNEEKNRRKNREKYNQEQIEKDESIIKKILKRSYKAKTQEHNSNLFIKKKSSYWLNINKKALILSQKTTNESQSPARIVQKIRVGFKCNKNEKKNDIIEMKSNDKGNEEIDELKKKVETQEEKIKSLKEGAWCYMCDTHKARDKFYVSTDPLNKSGLTPICKDCARKIALKIGKDKVEHEPDRDSVIETMRYLNKPFLSKLWDASIQESENLASGKVRSNGYYSYIKNFRPR